MAFDFKKEYKEFYMPKNKPEIITVPKANYIAVRGKGDPNEEDGAYQQAISVLYAVAYTLKMSYKTDHKIAGFFEYVSHTDKMLIGLILVPPSFYMGFKLHLKRLTNSKSQPYLSNL